LRRWKRGVENSHKNVDHLIYFERSIDFNIVEFWMGPKPRYKKKTLLGSKVKSIVWIILESMMSC
jgi:hypothetical protein